MEFCPFCGNELDGKAIFCERCGERIPRCPKCGEIIKSSNIKFCRRDGTKIPQETLAILLRHERGNTESIRQEKETNEKKQRRRKKSGKRVLLSLVFLVAAICLITGLVLINKDRLLRAVVKNTGEDSATESSLEEIAERDDSVYSDTVSEDSGHESTIQQESEITVESVAEESVPTDASRDTKPVIEWKFDTDLSATNGTKSIAFGDTAIVELDNISAAAFDGDGDYISCGNGINMSDSFTFNSVIKCTDINKDYSAFFAKWESNPDGPYAFSVNQGYVNCWVTGTDGGYFELESDTKLNADQWYCVSIVRDGDTINLYIDGRLERQGIMENVIQNSDEVTIGRQALMFEPEDQLQFTGYIASIAIYDSAFDADQIAALSDKSLDFTR